jgi:hypothetical protein
MSFEHVRMRRYTDKFRLVDHAVSRGAQLALVDEFIQDTAGNSELACGIDFGESGHGRASRGC